MGLDAEEKCCEFEKCMEYIQLMLDNESTNEQDEYVMAHLEKCSACFEQYEVEKQVRALLRAKVDQQALPENLVSEIRSKIRSVIK